MSDKLNRRGFFGIISAVAAALGISKATQAKETVQKAVQKYVPPTRPPNESGPIPDRSFYSTKPWIRLTPKEVEATLKTSSFLICPECGNDMQWARCECGFVWTNRVDEVAGGGQRQYDRREPDIQVGALPDKTIVEPIDLAAKAEEINAARAGRRAIPVTPFVDNFSAGDTLYNPLPPPHGI